MLGHKIRRKVKNPSIIYFVSIKRGTFLNFKFFILKAGKMYFDFEEKQPNPLPRIKTPRLDEMRSHHSLSVIRKAASSGQPSSSRNTQKVGSSIDRFLGSCWLCLADTWQRDGTESLQKPQIANETTDSGFVGSEVSGIWTASEMGTLLREKACLWAWGKRSWWIRGWQSKAPSSRV